MSFKDFWNKTFSYSPQDTYNFTLENTESTDVPAKQDTPKKDVLIYPSLNVNLEYMKIKYNTLINSDIVLREFTINARGKQYNAFILYIDGMVNSEIMDKFILEPLMLRNRNNLYDGSQNKVISEAITNNITVRKVKKFDLSSYLTSCLIPQNDIKKVKTFDEACNRN